ncbi:MAG TPA: hypothetical protein VIZ20_05200 [Streptosporangiaceae bacterium]
MIQPVRASASWVRDGTPDDAVSALVAYARTHNGRATVEKSQVTIRFGSRLAFRLMGLWTRRVPYAVRVSVAAPDSGSAELTAEGYSDEGWYLIRTDSADLTFDRRIAETLDDLRQQ